jgi:hypothetical protein
MPGTGRAFSSGMRKWLAGVALLAAAGVVYVATRDADGGESKPAETTPDRVKPTAKARTAPPRQAAPAVEPGQIYHVPWNLSDPTPSIKKWKKEGLPGTFREIVAPDDTENIEEKLLYKQRRLRFKLSDAAAVCYDGPDSKEQISLGYTMIVKDGLLRVDNVQVLTSDLSSHAVQECIVSAVRNLATTAPGIPDSKKTVRSTIGLHDLWVRNRGTGE